MKTNLKGLLLTTFGVLFFLTASASSTEVLRLSFQSSNKINLIYTAATNNRLIVKIYDSGKAPIFTEYVTNNYGLARVYDITALPEGEYFFEVIDGKQRSVKNFSYKKELINQPKDLKVEIAQSAGGKFNLICKGVNNKPVRVSIYSKSQGVIYEDYIESKVDFSRVYDLTKLAEEGYVFEVISDERIVTKEVSLVKNDLSLNK